MSSFLAILALLPWPVWSGTCPIVGDPGYYALSRWTFAQNFTGDTIGAGNDLIGSMIGPEVMYSFAMPAGSDYSYDIDLVFPNKAVDSVLWLMRDQCNAGSQFAFNDDQPDGPFHSRIQGSDWEGGRRYYICVETLGNMGAPFTLRVEINAIPPPTSTSVTSTITRTMTSTPTTSSTISTTKTISRTIESVSLAYPHCACSMQIVAIILLAVTGSSGRM